jgi:hypothetical protein
MSDVKQAVKTSTKIKWQNRWTIRESGRQLYDLIPMVGVVLFNIFKLELSFFVPFAYVILTCVFAGSCYDMI